jgi:hypothetical protein
MTNQLPHVMFFSDLNKVALCRVFKTDEGWIMESQILLSVLVANPSIARAITGIGVLCKTFPSKAPPVVVRMHLGRWRCHNAGCERQIFTERLSNLCAPYAQQTKRTGEIIAAVDFS